MKGKKDKINIFKVKESVLKKAVEALQKEFTEDLDFERSQILLELHKAIVNKDAIGVSLLTSTSKVPKGVLRRLKWEVEDILDRE